MGAQFITPQKLTGSRPSLAEYAVEASIDRQALLLSAIHRATKHEFRGTFGKEDLLAIGFIPSQTRDLGGILRLVEAAIVGEKGKHAGAERQEDGDCGAELRLSVVKEDSLVAYTFVMPQRKETDILRALVADLRTQVEAQRQVQDRLVAQQLPAGTVVMWSGAADKVPDGWRLCDGRGGAPDLRDRFLIGAGGRHQVGRRGGSSTHSHSVSVASHAVTIAEMPKHSHGSQHADFVCDGYGRTMGAGGESHTCGTCYRSRTADTGGGEGHTHAAFASSSAHLPPFFAIAFIVKQ